MPLDYRSPLTAVLLRRLAWETYVAGREFTTEEVRTKHLPAARRELGLPPIEATDATTNAYLRSLFRRPKRLRLDGQYVRLVGGWEAEWRLYYLPSHDDVRQLSLNPLVAESIPAETGGHRAWSVLFRDPALPKLQVIAGPAPSMAKACQGHRGVYVMYCAGELYIGQSSLPEKRIAAHAPHWTVFMAPEDSSTLDYEELTVTEALLISFWGEVAILENATRGKLQAPGREPRQQGVLTAEAVSAVLLWMLRQGAELGLPYWTIPFKKWRTKNWPECYLTLDAGI